MIFMDKHVRTVKKYIWNPTSTEQNFPFLQRYPEFYSVACGCASKLSFLFSELYVQNSKDMNAKSLFCADV